MVHALRKVNTLLQPGGYVLEIHDLLDPPKIEVRTGENQVYVGQLFSDTDFENQRVADEAIVQVIHEGLFSSQQSAIFEYLMRSDSLESLIDWLEESWESAYLTQTTTRMITEFQERSGEEFEIVVRMISRIIKLEPD